MTADDTDEEGVAVLADEEDDDALLWANKSAPSSSCFKKMTTVQIMLLHSRTSRTSRRMRAPDMHTTGGEE